MAMMILSMQCDPKPLKLGNLELPTPKPDHKACSGGFTQPGLIGGWLCICACHKEKQDEDV